MQPTSSLRENSQHGELNQVGQDNMIVVRQHDCPLAHMKRALDRTDSLWTPTLTPVWGPRETKASKKCQQQGTAKAATAAVDARLRGEKDLLLASPDVNEELSKVSCQCRVRGSATCTSLCPCHCTKKSCGVDCECHGFCCNSFFSTPKLSIRKGALGEELYTRTDLPQDRLAFVVCGPIMTLCEYNRYHEKLQHRKVKHYGCTVSWPGSDQGLPGDPDLNKYVIDPFDDMTGALNHSCVPNVALEACWANGKVYAVGRTQRRIMAREALTYDYKWKGTNNPKEFAEICLCREASCRGFIADGKSKFMERTILHYEKEIARLQELYTTTDETLQYQYQSLATGKQSGLKLDDLEMELISNEDENCSLKATIEGMIAAVARSKAATAPVISPPDTNEESKKKRVQLSPLQKLGRRFCCRYEGCFRVDADPEEPDTDIGKKESLPSSLNFTPSFKSDRSHFPPQAPDNHEQGSKFFVRSDVDPEEKENAQKGVEKRPSLLSSLRLTPYDGSHIPPRASDNHHQGISRLGDSVEEDRGSKEVENEGSALSSLHLTPSMQSNRSQISYLASNHQRKRFSRPHIPPLALPPRSRYLPPFDH